MVFSEEHWLFFKAVLSSVHYICGILIYANGSSSFTFCIFQLVSWKFNTYDPKWRDEIPIALSSWDCNGFFPITYCKMFIIVLMEWLALWFFFFNSKSILYNTFQTKTYKIYTSWLNRGIISCDIKCGYKLLIWANYIKIKMWRKPFWQWLWTKLCDNL